MAGEDARLLHELESTRRHKKRGSGSQEKQEGQAAPVQVHLMYRDEDKEVADRDEVEERGAPGAGDSS